MRILLRAIELTRLPAAARLPVQARASEGKSVETPRFPVGPGPDSNAGNGTGMLSGSTSFFSYPQWALQESPAPRAPGGLLSLRFLHRPSMSRRFQN